MPEEITRLKADGTRVDLVACPNCEWQGERETGGEDSDTCPECGHDGLVWDESQTNDVCPECDAEDPGGIEPHSPDCPIRQEAPRWYG